MTSPEAKKPENQPDGNAPAPAEEPSHGQVMAVAGAVGLTAAAVNWAVDDERPAEPVPPVIAKPDLLEPKEYDSLTDVLPLLSFDGKLDTGATLNAQISLYESVYAGQGDHVYYHDGVGNLLHDVDLPREWDTLPGNKKQPKAQRVAARNQFRNDWHNDQRQTIADTALVLPSKYKETGYPLISTARLPNVNVSNNSIGGIIHKRAQEEISYDSQISYFNGESMTVVEAIERICEAYDVSYEVAIGVAGNESAFDREAKSDVGALGLFQFMPAAMKDGKAYMDRHPELGAKVRQGNFALTAGYKKNRFVQIELFCAYFLHIQDLLSAKSGPNHATLLDLEERLQTIDPGFSHKGLQEISAINGFHSGPARIRKCIKRFIDLSDDEIKATLGPGPFGVDVWPAILANAVGKVGGVKRQVFEYVPRVLAMSRIIRDDKGFYLDEFGREKNPPSPKKEETRGINHVANLAALFSAMAGLTMAGSTKAEHARLAEEPGTVGMSRRDFLIRAAAVTTVLAAPRFDDVARSVSALTLPEFDSTPETEVPEGYEHVYSEAYASLDTLYENLASKRRINRTPNEGNAVRKSLQPARFRMLKPTWESMLGKDGFKKVKANGRRVPKNFYNKASKLQRTYLDGEIATGNLVPMPANDPTKPYFCEQVGKSGGTSNNPDMMYMSAEYEPILEVLVELVNVQIYKFNLDPSAYGVKSFPIIPQVDALKISGALRTLEHAKNLRSSNTAATSSLSDHCSGQALDIASYTTQGGHMARFRAPMLDSDGVEQIPAGGMLDNEGSDFGKRTRELLSTFVGRALIALQEPLKTHHDIELAIRWESGQRNWHILIQP
jgi:hypothetical protein